MLTHMGHKFNEEEVEEILTAADVNGDGQLDYEGLLSCSNNSIACHSHLGWGGGKVVGASKRKNGSDDSARIFGKITSVLIAPKP